MDVVSFSETQTEQESHEEKRQSSPICICVRFDANPLDTADNVFRGVQSFHSLSEVVVPLKGMLLEETTLGDLLTEFMSRVIRRFPRLSRRTVGAFYLNVEGLPMSVDRLSEQSPLMRLDVNVNGGDTLDNFLAPPLTTGPTVYNITAHWLPNIEVGTNTGRNASEVSSVLDMAVQKNKKTDSINNAEEEEGKETENVKGRFSEANIPAPVIYPFTQRCTYTKLWPRICESNDNLIASMELAASRAAALTATLTEREAARKVRRKLESEELAARNVIMGDEQEARRTIVEIEEEGKEQMIRLMRLMPDDELQSDSMSENTPQRWNRYPVDTEPLFTPPSSIFKQELAKRVEETAWLSHVFALTSIAGSGLGVAKENKKKNQKDNSKNIKGTGNTTYAATNTTPVAAADGDGGSGGLGTVFAGTDDANVSKSESPDDNIDNLVVDEYSAAMEDLIQHYADVRRHLLLWERQTFRALTTEMHLILEKQKRLDEEILRTAFHEELENGGVLDFNNYAIHYDQQHALTQKDKTPDITTNDSSQSSVNYKRQTSPIALESFGIYSGKELKNDDFKTEVKSITTTKTTTTTTTTTGQMEIKMPSTLTLPPRPRPRSPRSCLADDKKFHQAIEESRARAKAILETIALIDMRYHEPVSFKLAKHRLMLTEKEERKLILQEERKKCVELVTYAKQRGLDLESREFLAYCQLIDPVVSGEKKERDALQGQEERHIALLLSLYHGGVERIKVLLRQRE